MTVQTGSEIRIRRIKIGMIIAMALMIIGLMVAFYFYINLIESKKELRTLNTELTIKQDSIVALKNQLVESEKNLTQLLREVNSKFVKSTDPNLSTRIEKAVAISNELTSGQLVELTNSLFDAEISVRKGNLQELLKYTEDEAVIQQVIFIGKENMNDAKGTVNSLFFLNRVKPELLKKYESELLPYLDAIKNLRGRNQAKGLAKEIRSKL